MAKFNKNIGFTLIELVVVIVILGVLAAAVAPRFIDLSSDARIASLNNIASQMRASMKMVQNKAIIQGLRASTVNPSGTGAVAQEGYIVDFGFGRSEVDFRNLCMESMAEDADSMNFFDFLDLSLTDDISTSIDNEFALIGYTIPRSKKRPTTEGCYIIYDSRATPNCTVTVVTVDC